MKWVLLAIILVIVPYTFLTLRYRKPNPAFQPYEDLRNRANVTRLLAAGYQRIPLAAQRPADPSGARPTATTKAPGGLPADLRSTLVETPLLPADIITVAAAPTGKSAAPYDIRFSCTLPDDRRQLAGADLYAKGDELVITPVFEPLNGELAARSRDNIVLITIPAGVLRPGRYHVTLAAQQSSRTWSLDVK